MSDIKCKKCFGKGFRTEIKGRRELPHKFSDEVGCYTYSEQSGKQIGSFIKVIMCNCEKGIQLNLLIDGFLKEQNTKFAKLLKDIVGEEAIQKFNINISDNDSIYDLDKKLKKITKYSIVIGKNKKRQETIDKINKSGFKELID